ncbi:MAG: thioredoxin-related protein [Sulfurimonas sp.]|jgi:thioredoxin-related protein|uniref:thioredoxin family protein n=1 Tax=Sulfurimonas sp. TaxID=2022749 RepID=UPI0039E70C89
MKKLFLLLLLSSLVFSANIDHFAKEMQFQRDYKTALSQAQKENKVLMMVVSSDYCPWCRKFENRTLKSPLIQPRLNKELVTLVVDSKYDVDSFPEKYKTKYTPYVFFINPKDESILTKSVGYTKKKEFAEIVTNSQVLYKKSK